MLRGKAFVLIQIASLSSSSYYRIELVHDVYILLWSLLLEAPEYIP